MQTHQDFFNKIPPPLLTPTPLEIEKYQKGLELLVTLIDYAQRRHIDLSDILRFYLKKVCKFSKWPIGVIYFIPEKEPFTLVASNIHFIKHEKKFTPTIKYLFKKGEDLARRTIEADSPLADTISIENKGSIISSITWSYALPLHYYDKVIGVAQFFSKRNHEAKKGQLDFVAHATRHINMIIERETSEKKIKYNKRKLEATLVKLKETQMQLVQHSKMISIGELAAGMAHEINNPMGYVQNNLSALQRYVTTLSESLKQQHPANTPLDKNIEFILSDIDNLFSESFEGIQQILSIVSGLKSFARTTDSTFSMCDINECIENSLKMARNQLKYKCEIKKELSTVPTVYGNYNQLTQVFVNLLVNASQAIAEKGTITVKTFVQRGKVVIVMADTGCGISQDNIHKIFDPFFTTKPIGIGCGLGLSITYGIIQDHGGTIDVTSKINVGTTFIIRLPFKV
ncbi:MAG: ATP-binding protein [Candidatus Berkiella sp.]